MVLTALIPWFGLLTAAAQVGQTVTWTGGNTFAPWSVPANWSPAMVPLNDLTTSYTVVVPDSTSIRFDAAAGGKIEALSFGVGSQLALTNGKALEVTGVAVIKGIISATNAGSTFKAPANTLVLSGNPRLYATGGGVIELGGSTYSWEKFNGNATLLSALGTGSKVDLRNISSLSVSYGDSGSWTYALNARSNGVVDLSSLANLVGPGSDDMLEINAESGGQVLLSNVRQVNNRVRFNLGVPLFELPEATTISSATFNVKTGVVVRMPKLASVSESTISADSNSVFTASLLGSMADVAVTLGRGTVFQAPELTSMDAVPLTLTGDASFLAPKLWRYRNSGIPIDPSRNFQPGMLTDIYGSWINVTGGAAFTIGATNHTLPGFGNYTYPPKKVLSASGLGSILNASSIRSVRMTGADYVWDPDTSNWRSDYTFTVVGEDQGVVDLSGLLEAYGGDTASHGNNDWLVFRVLTGGNILLPNLQQALRHTGFEIGVGQYNLPALERIQLGKFTLADGAKLNLPSLTNFDNSSITFGFNSTFNAPQLRTFVNSDLNLAPGRIFTVPPFTNFNASRLSVSSGSTLSVAALEYETLPDWRWSPTLLSADGAGSSLGLASLKTMRVYGGSGGAWNYTVNANNNGIIDLSGLEIANGPDWGSYDNDDWLTFSIQNGGKIQLGSLREMAGRTRIHVGAGQRLELPGLTRVSNGAGFNLDAGSTLIATQLVDIANASLNLSSAVNLQIGSLTNIYSAQLSISGGRTLVVTAESYESPGMGNYTSPPRVPFSVDGLGSLLDASALKSMRFYGVDYGWDPLAGTWKSDFIYSVLASDRGVADFSGVKNLYGPLTSDYGNNDWLEFAATTGGILKLGDVSVERRVRFSAANPDSALHFKSLYLRSPATMSLGAATTLRITGDFLYENTDVNSIVTEFASVVMDGAGPQRLEVGGADIGASTTTFRRNFGHSQLIVGSATNRSIVRLVDSLNNGARGMGGQPEALYLYGLSGQGLRLLSGSVFVLNNLNCYASVNSRMEDLRALIPAGSNSVVFDGGVIANFGGPAITNLSPSTPQTPPISFVDITFNTPVQVSSFTTADVSITGPSGTVPVTGLTQLNTLAWRISFPAQSLTGSYTVKVGPAVNELAANLVGMDQDGDGVAGSETDVFTGAFEVDGTAPGILSVFALQNGTSVGIRFNEPVAPEFATNLANYLVNGVVPVGVTLSSNGSSVVLKVPALVGESFTVQVSNQQDLLGNKRTENFSGSIMALAMADIGTPGSNPRELGSTVTFDGKSFQTIAGGSDFFWNSSDAGHFVYEQRSGDFDVRVRVSRLDKTLNENYAQAGLMWRESLAANSRHAYVLVTPPAGGNNYYGVTRPATGASGTEWSYTNPSARSGVPLPNAWLRLKREGSLFIAFRSTNGVDWVELGRSVSTFPAEGFVGMATSARNNNVGQTTTAWYEEFSDLTPSFASHPQGQTVASGATVTFAAEVRGMPDLAYQWLFNGQPLPGATGSSLTLNGVSTEAVGDYRLTVSNAWGSATSLAATLVVDGIGSGGFEGDLSPAPNGNNSVTVADWVKVGRFVAGLDTPLNTSEFVRSDCAPRTLGAELVLGDGRMSVADWTQCGRYAAGLDPLTAAGGPSVAAIPLPIEAKAAKEDSGRSLGIGSARGWIGTEVELPVTLASLGDENAVGFSICYDAQRLKFVSASLGKDSQGATIVLNDNAGRTDLSRTCGTAALAAGVLLSKPIGQVFPAGEIEIARLRFEMIGEPGTAELQFADAPVAREIVDAAAQPVSAGYIAGVLECVAAPRFQGVKRSSNGAVQMLLNGPAGETCEVQYSSDLVNWHTLSRVQLVDGSCEINDSAAATHANRFYRLVPAQ